MENGPFVDDFLATKIVIFNSYFSLPEGNRNINNVRVVPQGA